VVPIACLSIAGSDSSGGAGIEADVRTFFSLRAQALTAITGLTAQNTLGVRGLFPTIPAQLAKVLAALGEDFQIASVKVGMLPTLGLAQVVAEFLSASNIKSVVVDPIFAASSGDFLCSPGEYLEIQKLIFPFADVVTPNFQEAGRILSCQEQEIVDGVHDACEKLAAMGAKAVVMTGGDRRDSPDMSVDYCFMNNKLEAISSPRVMSKNTHGTGCTFSSALSFYLAKGLALPLAVRASKEHVLMSLRSSVDYAAGGGRGASSQWWALRE